MKPLKNALHLLCVLGLVASMGCQSDSPTEPSGNSPATPKPPTPTTTYTITVTSNPTQILAGSQTPTTVTVNVRRSDTGEVPADLTTVNLSTSLGNFGSLGSGLTTTTVQLVNGRAQIALYPTDAVGTATIQATLGASAGAGTVQITQPGTFFISSVSPAVGSVQGGQEVSILGGGFDNPVRVLFGAAAAQVISVTPTRIRVLVPSAAASGNVPDPGSTASVSVSVTINFNETNTDTDTLANGFTYSDGNTTTTPRVFSVSPTSGTNDGGTRVTIVGEGFQSPVQVLFGQGGQPASFNGVEASVVEVTSNRIVVIAPPARGFGQNNVNQIVSILIRNLNTGFSTVAGGSFKYGNQVIVTAAGPGSGPYTGGTRVTVFGQGFDEPVALTLGGIGQTVLSVTGTEIVFLTSGTPVTACPTTGLIPATGINVTNIDTGDSGFGAFTFNYVVPLPIITGINPTSGSVGAQATISGQNFGSSVQVIFGDPINGSSASIVSRTSTSIVVRVPTAPPSFVFTSQSCDDNGDGTVGTRSLPTPISVTVRNLDGTGCTVTLTNAFTLNPPSNSCVGDIGPVVTTQCSDGIDNDGDLLIDLLDPGCTGPTDNSES